MSEGLDPIEAGRKLQHYGDNLREQSGGRGGRDDRHSRIVQICEATLLALVTVTAAWAGFSAAKWNTASRIYLARSAAERNFASKDELLAISLRNFDSSTFNTWFTAFTLHSKSGEVIAEHRFRPVFRVAFNAWLATNPLHNPHAPPGPTYMPQYKLAPQAKANVLDHRADATLAAGTRAGFTSDNYVKITVFLAAVLFLVGIGSTFKLNRVRYALVVFGSVLLIISIVLILNQPGLPSL